jgi:cytochrome c biogenesis protein CcmG, thiol:disulfide interchange protein DsbE
VATKSTARTQRRADRSPSGGGRPIVLYAGLAVVVLLGIVAIVVSRGGGTDLEAEGILQSRDVEVAGDPLVRFDAAVVPDPAVGEPAPELAGASFDGSEVAIADDGRPKAILFVAHWCPHCQREVPIVQGWVDEGNAPDNVDIYAVSTGVDRSSPNYPPSAWLEGEGWSNPVLADDGSAAEAFGLTSYPYWVFVDATGTVAHRQAGALTEDQIDAAIRLLAGEG